MIDANNFDGRLKRTKFWGKTAHLKTRAFELFLGQDKKLGICTFQQVRAMMPEVAEMTLRHWYYQATGQKFVTRNPPKNWEDRAASWYAKEFEKKKRARLKGLALSFGLNYEEIINMTNGLNFNDLTKFEKATALIDFVALSPDATYNDRIRAAEAYLKAIKVESEVERSVLEERITKQKDALSTIDIESIPIEEKYQFFKEVINE